MVLQRRDLIKCKCCGRRSRRITYLSNRGELLRNCQNCRRRYSAKIARRRDRIITRLGVKCAHCGLRDRRVIQIDHVKPIFRTGKQREKNSVFYAAILADRCADELQLLCANCHLIKTREDSILCDEDKWRLYVESQGGVVTSDEEINRPTRARKPKFILDDTNSTVVHHVYRYRGIKTHVTRVPIDDCRLSVPTISDTNAMMVNELVEANVR